MTVRLGVCGSAYWAEAVHMPGIVASSGGTLAGIYARNPERAASLAERFGVPAFASIDDLLAAVDAVTFAVPPDVQAGLATAAIRAGRHVLLEKPVAPTFAEARAIRDAAAEARVAASCFLTRMFIPAAGEFLARARASAPTRGTASFRSGALLSGPYAGSAWRQAGHGAVVDAAPHPMAMLASVLGPIRSVSAAAEADGTYRLRMEHDGGGRSTAEVNLRDPTTSLSESYAFDGGSGEVRLDALPYDRPATFASAVDALAAAAEGRGPAPSLDLAIHLVAAVEAAVRSLSSGAAEPVAPC